MGYNSCKRNHIGTRADIRKLQSALHLRGFQHWLSCLDTEMSVLNLPHSIFTQHINNKFGYIVAIIDVSEALKMLFKIS